MKQRPCVTPIDTAEPGEVIVSFCEHTDDIAMLLGGFLEESERRIHLDGLKA